MLRFSFNYNEFFKDFAAGLRSRNPAVRKSQYLLTNAISGGFSSVGLLVSKTNEDHLRQPEYDHKLSKDGVCLQ